MEGTARSSACGIREIFPRYVTSAARAFQSPRLACKIVYSSNTAMKQLASGLERHDFLVLLDVSGDAESCRQKVVKVAGNLSEVKKQK